MSPEEQAQWILDAFETHYGNSAVFDSDRELATDLSYEARPAVDAIWMALTLDTAGDLQSIGHHEGLVMLALLGRRAGVLGVTPAGAHGVVLSLAVAFEDAKTPIPEGVRSALALACFEGYVRGREEMIRDECADAASQGLVMVELAPRTFVFRLQGVQRARMITFHAEEFGRLLHRGEARAALVDITGLQKPTARRAHALAQAHEAAAMLGVPCCFGAATDEWRESLEAAGVVNIHGTYIDALSATLLAAGLRVGQTARERARRLLRRH